MERAILHCDLNNFYASVECRDNPELKDKAIAVCGSVEDRHGIVLAKNQLAKNFGVKTAEPIWQAKSKCPFLTIVSPHSERYFYFSKQARKIYSEYTDMIEPFGIDECWLDITGSTKIFGSPEQIAHTIRNRIKDELGLTISVGVSFNKTFAKLGSDMKKPDAVTVIDKNNFKSVVWPLPAEEILGVGKATKDRLNRVGIYTIGDIAAMPADKMKFLLGKGGISLWRAAGGYDNSPVTHESFTIDVKSVGNSSTGPYDLTTDEQAWQVILSLSEEVSRRMRAKNLLTSKVTISIKDQALTTTERCINLAFPTRSASILAENAMKAFKSYWNWNRPVRALGVCASKLVYSKDALQTNLFSDFKREERLEMLESRVDILRRTYGREIIKRAVLMQPSHMQKMAVTQ